MVRHYYFDCVLLYLTSDQNEIKIGKKSVTRNFLIPHKTNLPETFVMLVGVGSGTAVNSGLCSPTIVGENTIYLLELCLQVKM